jgi:hypothetical protein
MKYLRVQLRKRMHARVPGTVKWLQQVVRGYFQYHAIPGNFARLRAFRREVVRTQASNKLAAEKENCSTRLRMSGVALPGQDRRESGLSLGSELGHELWS